jgi:diguanylate cyclase (GGDEF)-like protein
MWRVMLQVPALTILSIDINLLAILWIPCLCALIAAKVIMDLFLRRRHVSDTPEIFEEQRIDTSDNNLRWNMKLAEKILFNSQNHLNVEQLSDVLFKEISDSLNLIGGGILIRDKGRPGFARFSTLSFQGDNSKEWIDQFHGWTKEDPISDQSNFTGLRVIANGIVRCDVSLTLSQATPSELIAHFIPLAGYTDTIGSIMLLSQGPLPDWFIAPKHDRLHIMSTLLGMSIERAQLSDELRCGILRDPLTGLLTHQNIHELAHQQMEKGLQNNTPVSILMIDIDHFHQINERLGHDTGDLILHLVGQVIVANIRVEDSAARFGGEEFVALLPETGPEEAETVANRLHDKLKEILSKTMDFPITTSIGYGTFPLHATTPNGLLRVAELALYSAKRSGRDRCAGYHPDLLQMNTQLLSGSHNSSDRETSFLPMSTNIDSIQALVTALDLKDGYTGSHSQGVAKNAVAIGQKLALPVEQIEALHLGGLLHDVGKIGIPDDILRKPGPLTHDEMEFMKRHPAMGEEIVRSVEQLHHLLPLVRWHHEKLDGSGYPDGLRSDEISLLVRILTVADIFDAYTAERPYHKGRSSDEGIRFLQREAEQGKLDTQVVEMLAIVIKQYEVSDDIVSDAA